MIFIHFWRKWKQCASEIFWPLIATAVSVMGTAGWLCLVTFKQKYCFINEKHSYPSLLNRINVQTINWNVFNVFNLYLFSTFFFQLYSSGVPSNVCCFFKEIREGKYWVDLLLSTGASTLCNLSLYRQNLRSYKVFHNSCSFSWISLTQAVLLWAQCYLC